MKVVIDISENDYWLACKYPDVLTSVYAHAIKNGTPLPKGHGDLIDADEVKKDHMRWLGYLDDDMILRLNLAVDKIQTIIEADNGETE